MKDKGHFYISVAKSVIRILACLVCVSYHYWGIDAFITLSLGFGVAEI